jgi:hypothetical protein
MHNSSIKPNEKLLTIKQSRELYKFKIKGAEQGLLLLFLLYASPFFAQQKVKSNFYEAEILIGSIVPNFPNFPKTGISRGINLSVGKTNFSSDHWANYYNKPSYGVSISYSESSNIKELGKEYGGSFFLDLSPNLKTEQLWFFRLGMGATYFSRFYKKVVNERNKIIGSHWNWRFKAFLFRQLKAYNSLNLRLGAGYVHSSNGHTQIPNYGMNAAMLSLSARFYTKNPYQKADNFKRSEDYAKVKKEHFIQSRFGLGVHEYGGTTLPIGGDKKAVYAYSLAYGIKFNQQLKLRSGFTYRFYQQYFDEINSNDSIGFKSPRWGASNLYWLLGIEYLIGNFAIDVEGGINLHKPFYKYHFEQHERKIAIHKFLKSTFPMRMGLNAYLFKPEREKMFNAFIGVSINANFGQADFSQLNIGLSKKIFSKKGS